VHVVTLLVLRCFTSTNTLQAKVMVADQGKYSAVSWVFVWDNLGFQCWAPLSMLAQHKALVQTAPFSHACHSRMHYHGNWVTTGCWGDRKEVDKVEKCQTGTLCENVLFSSIGTVVNDGDV
jgi:hypothetical protein